MHDQVEPARLLVVDDEQVIREILSEFLTMEGYVVCSVEDGERALTELRLRAFDLVISDLKMPKVGGLELLERIAAENLDVLTVIMTGFGTVETAIEAMKKGAYDYIVKPFKIEDVIRVVERGLERQRLQAENIRLSEALNLYRVSEAIATSLDLDHILDVILRAALTEADADVASLHLQAHQDGAYEERVCLIRDSLSFPQGAIPSPDVAELMSSFRRSAPVLAHGLKAHRFFAGAHGGQNLISYTALPLQIANRIIGILHIYSLTPGKKFSEGERKMLSILASRAAAAIDNARLYDDLVTKNSELSRVNLSLEEHFRQTVAGFAQALEESDLYTRGHSERVATYSELIARGLQLPAEEIQRVIQAGLLHDVGKIGIRYDMLNKPGKLTPEEIQRFREHPAKGRRILQPIPCMRHLIDACWCHHEWYDGGGYPRGLIGDNIPLLGRIVAIADAYDAMTSDRAYRRALPHSIAMEELERCSGTQFDPEIVKLFLHIVEEFRAEAKRRGELGLVPR